MDAKTIIAIVLVVFIVGAAVYHTEVGSNLYHICEFAERMQKNGATYEPKPAEQTPQKTPKHKDLER